MYLGLSEISVKSFIIPLSFYEFRKTILQRATGDRFNGIIFIRVRSDQLFSKQTEHDLKRISHCTRSTFKVFCFPENLIHATTIVIKSWYILHIFSARFYLLIFLILSPDQKNTTLPVLYFIIFPRPEASASIPILNFINIASAGIQIDGYLLPLRCE